MPFRVRSAFQQVWLPSVGRPIARSTSSDLASIAQTVISWGGWVVGSSVAGPIGDQHLVVTASPNRLRDYAKVVNGPAWRRGDRVRPLGWLTIRGQRMREVFVPPETNVGSVFASHIVLIWSVGDHTYAFGFHKMRGVKPTVALDTAVAEGLELVTP